MGVEQSVCTTPGRRYHLTFWVGNLVDEGGDGVGQTSMVHVWINGYPNFAALNDEPSRDSCVVWKRFDMPFVAEKAWTRIGLTNDDPFGDKVNGIDDVELAAE
jgi:hypothetical protein